MSLTGGSDEFDTTRLRGYSIRVSNTTNVSPVSTYVCFTDDKSRKISTIIQDNCMETARYVWFYQRQNHNSFAPILEICEVQVFGKLTVFDSQ